ncbi:MAG: hypothetical protein JWP81_4179 [Ferruginibacter sp.]|nr:hypothetical protein [Ferruginibacter sp.]
MPGIRPFVLLTLFVSSQVFAFSQDSLYKPIKFRLSANMWMQQNFEHNSRVSMPAFIKDLRSPSVLALNFDSLTDNPLKHGATYIVINSSATYHNKLTLNLDLYAEQRGASYGLFSKNNLLLYPVMSIEGRDSFKISNRNIVYRAKIGMFLNEKMDEGLTIYNVDAQGLKLSFEKKKWSMEYSIYGDFYGGIGLNIDDIYAVAVKRKLGRTDSAEIGFSFNDNKQPWWTLKNNFTLNVFGYKKFSNAKIYAQLGYRPVDDQLSIFRASSALSEKVASVLGFEYRYVAGGFKFMNTLEARYYGSIFNERYFDFHLRYRKPAKDMYEMYGNTVGEYLYPLRKFDTPFSQWAVYTEYIFQNVFSINLRGSLNRDLGQKTSLKILYDLNYIRSSDNFPAGPAEANASSTYLYPFFTASISYKIIREVETSFLLTNRSMNLDISYPTHYLLSRPRFGAKLTTSF